MLPPLTLHYNPMAGFEVKAAQDLPELTLLCEYLGQVRYESQTVDSQNDSIMELLCSKDGSESSLCVVPEVFSNVARFFNGINNSEKGSK
jgi:hypothetical protein